jgi:hypothetical protein
MIRIFQTVLISIFWICQCSMFVANAATVEKKPWTILVYLNADNSLEEFGYGDIQEMEKVGSNNNVNVVVQFDVRYPKGTQRLYITKAKTKIKDPREIQSKVIEEMPEQDMGNAKVFSDFVTWGMENYPAEHYMVVIWNHGGGWGKEARTQQFNRAVSFDDTSKTFITTNQLADAIDQVNANTGNRIDILAFDACVMSMVEILDSFAGMVDIVVASEETIPGDGYPYADVLQIFSGTALPNVASYAKGIVEAYGKSYAPGGSQTGKSDESSGEVADEESDGSESWYGGPQQVTLSAIDPSRVELIKRRLAKWVEVVDRPNSIPMDAHLKAIKDTISFAEPYYKDLGDYVKNILKLAAPKNGSKAVVDTSGIVGASLNLLHAIQSAVIANYTTSRYKEATGIAIYLPYEYSYSLWQKKCGEEVAQKYRELKFDRTANWAKHLDYLLPREGVPDATYNDSDDADCFGHLPFPKPRPLPEWNPFSDGGSNDSNSGNSNTFTPILNPPSNIDVGPNLGPADPTGANNPSPIIINPSPSTTSTTYVITLPDWGGGT